MKPQVKFKKSKKTSPKDVWRYKQVEAMWKTERKIPIDPKMIKKFGMMSGLQLSLFRAPTMTRARLIEKDRVEMMAKNIRSDVDAGDVRVVEDLVGDGDLDWSDIMERGRFTRKNLKRVVSTSTAGRVLRWCGAFPDSRANLRFEKIKLFKKENLLK